MCNHPDTPCPYAGVRRCAKLQTVNERPEQPPEGRLISASLKRTGLSARKAADLAGISEGRWRQIVNGYQTPSAGVHIQVSGPADTVARMARVVGVTRAELINAGREDAADALQDMELDEEYGDRTTEQLLAESEEIAGEIKKILEKKGLDLGARQRREIDRWSKYLIENLNDFDERNNAS